MRRTCSSLRLPRALFLLTAVCLLALAASTAFAQVRPSEPGESPAPFIPQRGPTPTDGTAILNVDTGLTYPTIQDAINAATAGDTLEVQAAMHTEGQIVVDRDLTLRGATGTEVVLMAVDTGSAGDARAWFLVEAGVDLQVRDLTFDGNGSLVYQAFRHRGTGSFEDCAFRDIQFNPSGPNYAGFGIVAFGGTVDVRRTTFASIGRVGILAFGAGVAGAVLEDNVYTGKGDGDFLDYSIEVGAGAVATLRNNVATDCRGIASVDGSQSGGFLVTTFFGAGTDATIESNTVTANLLGVVVGFDGADTSVVNASFNRVVGNATGLTSTAPPIAAENNWWGCNGGPGAAGCDTLAGNGVSDADPWLVLGIGAVPASIPTNTPSDVTADLVFNSDAVDTSGLGTVPDGTPVGFGATLGTIAPPAGATTAGFAMATFTAGAVAGLGSASATVDNETVTTDIEIVPGGLPGGALSIPTLGELGLVVLAVLVALGGLVLLRRRG